ncbi:tRNA-uridine aminocarboxypropyltransferase [Pokkaliibacter sp. CJK22405]|uniref:tRNA-uridine aminocarboxypropyltransferase n=1 Tax=Pokkaliibacter sp. CJK22405 TaxID=3384615 RepID=UPI0039853F51
MPLPFDLILLTHSNEYRRWHNTGRWLGCHTNAVTTITWSRHLTQAEISSEDHIWLVFPQSSAADSRHAATLTLQPVNTSQPRPTLLLLDGTWQEARKMLQQTPWLKELPRYSLESAEVMEKSEFYLRRNQEDKGLSTFETAARLCQAAGDNQTSIRLLSGFRQYQQAFRLSRGDIQP